MDAIGHGKLVLLDSFQAIATGYKTLTAVYMCDFQVGIISEQLNSHEEYVDT